MHIYFKSNNCLFLMLIIYKNNKINRDGFIRDVKEKYK